MTVKFEAPVQTNDENGKKKSKLAALFDEPIVKTTTTVTKKTENTTGPAKNNKGANK